MDKTTNGYLGKNSLLDFTLLYTINSHPGFRNTDVYPAKDFICCGLGIDVLGINHVGVGGQSTKFTYPPSSLNTTQQIQATTKQTQSTLALFNDATYGYEKTSINLEALPRDLPLIRKAHNIRKQSNEASLLQEMLKREDTLESYIKSKSQVNETIIKDSKDYRKIFR